MLLICTIVAKATCGTGDETMDSTGDKAVCSVGDEAVCGAGDEAVCSVMTRLTWRKRKKKAVRRRAGSWKVTYCSPC